MTRRLAALLAADVVGYSRLMEADEAATLAALKRARAELLDPKIAEHHGRIVKTTGDGVLAEFSSAVEAVLCATEVQREMTLRNAGVASPGRFEFRIGVNLGDVIAEGDDVYGDGVNIAARLEQAAPPGGVVVSEDVYRQVRGKVPAPFESMGQLALKNLSRPVGAYLALAGDAQAATPWLPPPDKPSLAVLPFDNMTGDTEQEHLVDGMVEEIIAALSRVKSFFVIARNSTFTYKGKAVRVDQVGRELGVRYVVEGSVRMAGNRIRLTAQLIEAESGRHVWAGSFEGTLDDIFALQDRITEQVVGALHPSIRLAETAARADDGDPLVLTILATAQMLVRSLEEATSQLARALAIDPNLAWGWNRSGWLHVYRGEPEIATRHFERAIRRVRSIR
ncbi:MAG TPA: adenylate/guanylate cyclase domain-containing protein [Alphaproteobacteria bacterium]|nr:adenylate/guanylate cyclase domain-containing protein [Alphaproteobacteria bacterium]